MGIEAFRFDGKQALIVGGATGMGAAAAQIMKDLGANVVVMDYAPVKLAGVKGVKLDLRDRASIDSALAEAGKNFDVVLSCAGIADGTPGVEKVNFIGQRHLIERLVNEGRINRGGAIGMISSVAGLGWDNLAPDLIEFLETPTFEAAVKWIETHPDKANYTWSKQAVCAYTARNAYPFLKKGVRINSIMPGPTDTPLARANADIWLAFATDYRKATDTKHSTPEEQAYPLIFLCSQAASHVNGQNIVTDAGHVSAGFTGAFDAPFFKQMMGR